MKAKVQTGWCKWHSEPCWEPRVTTKYTMVGNLEMLGTFRCQGDIWGLYLKTRLPGFLKNMVSSHAPCWSTNGVHCQHHQWNMTEVVVWVLKKKVLIWLLLDSKLKQSSRRWGRETEFGHFELWWCQAAEKTVDNNLVFFDHTHRINSIQQPASPRSCSFDGHALITALQSVF